MLIGKIAGRCHHVFWPKFRPVCFPVFPPPISLHLQVLTIHRAVIRASACHATLNCGHWISFFGQKVWVAVYDFFTKLEWNTPSCTIMESTPLSICESAHYSKSYRFHSCLPTSSQYWSQLSFSAHTSLNKKYAQRSHYSESYQHENYGLMVDRSPITSYIWPKNYQILSC